MGQKITPGSENFKKLFGLYSLKHNMVEISGDVTEADRANKQTWEDRAAQPVVCTNASSYLVLKTTLNHKNIYLFSHTKNILLLRLPSL